MKYDLLSFETYFQSFPKLSLSTRHIKGDLLATLYSSEMLVSLPLYYSPSLSNASVHQPLLSIYSDISTAYCHIRFNCIRGSPGLPVLPTLWWRPIVTFQQIPPIAHSLPPMVLGGIWCLTHLQPGQHGGGERILAEASQDFSSFHFSPCHNLTSLNLLPLCRMVCIIS